MVPSRLTYDKSSDLDMCSRETNLLDIVPFSLRLERSRAEARAQRSQPKGNPGFGLELRT